MQEVNPDNINLNVDQDEEKKNLEENAAESPNVMTVAGASLKAALVHANAKRVYESKKWDDMRDDYDLCPCCNLPVTGKLIPLNSSLKRTYHLGSGFALYFRFIKSCIALLLIVFFISGLYNIITDEQADNCDLSEFATDDSYCVQGYILTYAIPNKRFDKHLLMIQQALNLTTVVVIMFFFHYIRFRFRKTEVQADDDTITPSDYTCVFDHIDPETKEKEFRQWLCDIAKKDNIDLKIARVVKTYAITEYIKLKNTEKDIQKKLNNAMKKVGQKTPKEEKFIYDQKNALTVVREKLTNVKKAGIKRSTTLYVTLSTAKESAYLQEKFKSSIFGVILRYIKPSFISTIRDFKGRQIKVNRAPEPTDILWENLGYTTKQKYKNRVITTFITFFLLCISLGIILLLNWAQNVAKDKNGSTSALVQGLSIIISLAICVINAVLAILIDFLTKYEKHVTYTNYLKGVAQKLSIAQFMNTALISLFVELILADDSDNSGQNRLELVNFYGKGGLLEGIYWVFITNALLPPVMTIFDPGYIFKRFRQYLAAKAADDLKMTQAEANLLFEGPAITMPTKYAAMIKMLLLTTFYAPALPFCMIFTIGGLSIYYWAEKYVLLRRSALPNMIGDELADEMIEYAEWAACTFAVGNIIFTYTLKDYYGHYAFDDTSFVLAWITFGISLVHIFFPMELINKKLFPIKDEVTENDTFVQARPDFDTDYDVENPITHRKAFKELQDIKEKAILRNRRESNIKGMQDVWQKDVLPNIGAGDVKLLFPDKKVEDERQFAAKDGERDEDEPKAEGEENQQQPNIVVYEEQAEAEDDFDDEDDQCDFDDLDKFADQAKTELQMNAKVEGTNLEKMGTYLSNAVENGTPANIEGVMKMFNLSPGSDREPLKVGSPNSPNDFVVDVDVQNQPQERENDFEVVREEQKQETTKNRRRTQEAEVKPFEVEDKANINVDKANMNDESEQAIDMIGVTFTPAKEGVSKQISLLEEPGKAKLTPLNVRPLSSESAKLQDKHNFVSDTPKTVNNLSEDTENSRIQDQEGNNEQ